MQLEWSRWLEGITAYRQEQGMLWIFCILFLGFLWHRRQFNKNILWSSLCVLLVLVVCPLSAVVLLKGFTPYYIWEDLQLLFPMPLVLGAAGVFLVNILSTIKIPDLAVKGWLKQALSIACVCFLMMAAVNFHGFDKSAQAGANGIPAQTEAAFAALEEQLGEQRLILAAPGDVLSYTRLYSTNWYPMYGSDLWNPKSASLVASGYETEYRYYELLEQAELSEEGLVQFQALMEDALADCVIVPAYWQERLLDMPAYEYLTLTDSYMGIVKKELITK